MEACLNCDATLDTLHSDIHDYEYGVPWKSSLVICDRCGLVTQAPRIQPADIETLYPANYHAHSGGTNARGLYWQLRKLLSLVTLSDLLKQVKQSGRLLEVGCGNGSFLKLVAEARPDLELHGVDIVDTGLSIDATLNFHQGQLESIELSEKHFDAIYFSNLIEHVPDPMAFLKKCHRLLRPGGIVYGNTPDHLSIDRFLFGKYWAGYHYPRHTFVFDHHNLPELLRKCGYHQIHVSGGYAFWSLSLRNMTMEGHGPRRRGLVHAFVTGSLLPFDLLVNVFRCHGAMTFVAAAAD